MVIFVQKLNDNDILLGYLDVNLFVKLTYLAMLTDASAPNKSEYFLNLAYEVKKIML